MTALLLWIFQMIRHEIIPLIAKGLKPAVYVELGIGYAGSILLSNMIDTLPDTEIWGIDIVDMRAEFSGRNANIFHGSTEQFHRLWEEQGGKPIDLIFIDADHCAESVLEDVGDFLPFLTPDTGIMILHDTWPVDRDWTGPDKSGDSYKVPKVLKSELTNVEIFTLPIHHGLTFIRKVGDNWRNE